MSRLDSTRHFWLVALLSESSYSSSWGVGQLTCNGLSLSTIKIQKRATKLVIKLKNKSYIDRLIYLNLPTLKYRCLRGDVIEVFKITHNLYDRTVSPDLPFNERANTRGNHYKLQNHLCHYDLRMHFFSACIVNIWNSLPNSVVDTCTVNAFKARFDKFWRHQIVKFYFTAPSPILQLI